MLSQELNESFELINQQSYLNYLKFDQEIFSANAICFLFYFLKANFAFLLRNRSNISKLNK